MNVLGFVIVAIYLINTVVYGTLAIKTKDASVVKKATLLVIAFLSLITLLILFGTGPGVLA